MFRIFKKTNREAIAKATALEEQRVEEASVKVMSFYKVEFEYANGQIYVYNELATDTKQLQTKVKKHYQLFLKNRKKWVNPWVGYENGDEIGTFNLNYIK